MSTGAREVGTVHSRAEAAKPSSPRQVKRSDRKTDPRKPAVDLLALQRNAGNRAVTGLLAAAATRKVQRLRGDENLAKGGDLWHAQGKHYKIVEVREEGKKRFLLEEVAEAEPEVKAATPALPPEGGDAPPLPKGAPLLLGHNPHVPCRVASFSLQKTYEPPGPGTSVALPILSGRGYLHERHRRGYLLARRTASNVWTLNTAVAEEHIGRNPYRARVRARTTMQEGGCGARLRSITWATTTKRDSSPRLPK